MTDQTIVFDTRPIIDELHARLSAQISDAIKALEAKASAGWVTPAGEPARPEAKSFGDFLLAVKRNDARRLEQTYGSTKALSSETGSEGGYLIPAEFGGQIVELARPLDVFAQLGAAGPLEVPMRSRTLEYYVPDYSKTPPAGADYSAAGMVSYWTSDNQAVTETEPAFRQIVLTAHTLAAYTAASREVDADSAAALEGVLSALFARTYAARKLHAFLRGTGVGQPRGVLNHPATIGVTRGTGAAIYEADDLLHMLARLLPSSQQRAVWFAHPFARRYLATVKIDGGDAYAWGDVRTGLTDTLLGRPIYYVDFMPQPGAAGDLLLADWTYYVFGNRQSFSVAYSEHVRFLQRQHVWLLEARFDGQPMLNAPITLGDGVGTNTVSPFVQLN
jgi:HK97 family phage major capsid protein